ncbi:LysR family transcriptional regulator [Actinoplanes couchii]|uniref:Transcriptional regulator, LysR family protein n=1 Tax=Actinoplanes couchii TaxID=403638 RepID=A0ABQ3XLW4_9ACTN|nr:LysR family transcriptional regulator [Actinoplanes couchii]MDR6319382.1 DNA-binding transcriptional LysR family regulator [Actinoplanes couchii]GID59407.1 putative transcriptional regulator, LysR family protein [Actinoplanes couchii]
MNDSGQDLELRLVRYFTAVADHQNFGRAATALHLAQPALSRQIQRLERHLGARLLDRIPQGTRLTPAGQAFLPHARALLRAAGDAEKAVHDHTGTPRITIGYVEDLTITAAVRRLRRAHPTADITTCHLNCRDITALADGHVDALIARAPLPLTENDIETLPLYDEPRMLVVPNDHPLATRTTVTTADLAGEPTAPCAFTTTDWTSYQLFGTGLPPVDAYQDKLQLVAEGRAIAVLPTGDRRSTLRPDLTTIPVQDAPPSRIILVNRRNDPNPMLPALRAEALSRR